VFESLSAHHLKNTIKKAFVRRMLFLKIFFFS